MGREFEGVRSAWERLGGQITRGIAGGRVNWSKFENGRVLPHNFG